MSNEEKILAMLENLTRDMAEVKTRLDTLEEGQEEIRGSVNRLVAWADECTYAIKLPLPKI